MRTLGANLSPSSRLTMASTVVTCVTCVTSVHRTAESARKGWSGVREAHEKLEALCAAEETEEEAAELPETDPLIVLGACVQFVTSCAEYVALSDAYKTRNGKGHPLVVVHALAF